MKHLLFCAFVVFIAFGWTQVPPDEVALDVASPARGTVTLGATVSESLKAKVEKLVFLKNGKLLAEGVLKEGRWLFSWDTNEEADGQYRIMAQVIIGERQVDSPELIVDVDNTAPELEILPMRQEGGKAVICANAVDKGSGVDFVEMTVAGQKPQAGILVDKVYTWEFEGAAESTAVITATDKAGNQTQAKSDIRLDLKGPAILQRSFFLAPVQNPLVCEFEIEDPAGVKNVEFQIDGHLQFGPEVTREDILYRVVWKKLTQGEHRITVTAVDSLENVSSFSITVKIDDISPVVEWAVPPKISARPVPISIKVGDSSEIAEVLLLANEQVINVAKQDGIWQTTWAPPQDGRYTLKVRAKDTAGNIGESAPIAIVYDTTPPQGNLTLPDREYFNKEFVALAAAKDELSGIDRVVFTVGKHQIKAKPTGDSFSALIEMKKSGSFQIGCAIYDLAGNMCELAPRTVAADRIAPTVEFTGDFPLMLRDKGQLAVEARDDFSGVAEIILTTAGKELCRIQKPGPESTIDIDFSSFKEGTYQLVAMAGDLAGNKIKNELGTVIVDRTPPEITGVKLPKSFGKGMAHVKIDWQDSLSGVDAASVEVFLKIEGKSYPFKLDLANDRCEGQLLIGEDFPKKAGEIYIAGLRDRAGNVTPEKLLGKIEYQKVAKKTGKAVGESEYKLADKLLIAYLTLAALALLIVLATKKSVYR